jgi:hypothetical protein
MSKKPLYIHLHIPKTAGYTFRYHVSKNIPKDQQIFLCYEFLGLDLFKPPLKYEIYKKSAFNFIKKLTKEKRDNIKIIHGHTVPYGINELFDREPRYFTFVRNPVDRTASIYNHLSYLNEIEGSEIRKKEYYEKYLLINGIDPGFKKWLREKYIRELSYPHFSQAVYLKEFGYINGQINEENIMKGLSKFYFIGQTENFNSESMYFFSELGMRKFFIDQNISHKKIINYDSKVIKEIQNRNLLDSYLYNQSGYVNKLFKKEHPEFDNKVRKQLSERKLLLPFTQLIFAPRQTFLRFWGYLLNNDPLNSNPKFYSKKIKQ